MLCLTYEEKQAKMHTVDFLGNGGHIGGIGLYLYFENGGYLIIQTRLNINRQKEMPWD